MRPPLAAGFARAIAGTALVVAILGATAGPASAHDELPSHMLGDANTFGSAFNKPGSYLVGTTLPEFSNPNKGKGVKKTVGIVLVVVALALLLGYVLPTILRRSRAAQAAQAAQVARSRGPQKLQVKRKQPAKRRR